MANFSEIYAFRPECYRVQLVGTGITGEYTGRLSGNVRNRPCLSSRRRISLVLTYSVLNLPAGFLLSIFQN